MAGSINVQVSTGIEPETSFRLITFTRASQLITPRYSLIFMNRIEVIVPYSLNLPKVYALLKETYLFLCIVHIIIMGFFILVCSQF